MRLQSNASMLDSSSFRSSARLQLHCLAICAIRWAWSAMRSRFEAACI